jgi:hypothetical protein
MSKSIIHPHLKPSPGKGTGSFPLLHFLLPPGEENRGKGLRRERKIKVVISRRH